jgi:hypothetical protein
VSQFLLGVHADHRLAGVDVSGALVIEVGELGIAVDVGGALDRLGVALQAGYGGMGPAGGFLPDPYGICRSCRVADPDLAAPLQEGLARTPQVRRCAREDVPHSTRPVKIPAHVLRHSSRQPGGRI